MTKQDDNYMIILLVVIIFVVTFVGSSGSANSTMVDTGYRKQSLRCFDCEAEYPRSGYGTKLFSEDVPPDVPLSGERRHPSSYVDSYII